MIRFLGIRSSSLKNSLPSVCLRFLKLASAIFHQIFIFHQMIALQKLWKIFFISSKKLFSFSRYSNFCISIFPTFLPASHWFRGCSKVNLTVYDVINCLNKNLITYFVWYLDKEERYDIETLSIDNFGKWPKTANSYCMQEILLKIRYFQRGLSKSLKKVNFIFSFEPSPF